MGEEEVGLDVGFIVGLMEGKFVVGKLLGLDVGFIVGLREGKFVVGKLLGLRDGDDEVGNFVGL